MRNSSGSKPEKNARKLAKILLAKRNLLFAKRSLFICGAAPFIRDAARRVATKIVQSRNVEFFLDSRIV